MNSFFNERNWFHILLQFITQNRDFFLSKATSRFYLSLIFWPTYMIWHSVYSVSHFCFGFLLAYPIRELFMRVAGARGFWGYYLPLDVTMSFSMLYELIEWGYAVWAGGDAATAFLGMQGDVWDAQKDMAMATLGAVVSMSIVAFINWKFDKNFGQELRQSLTLQDGDQHPTGRLGYAF